MESSKPFTAADKRTYIKVLELIAKQMNIGDSDKYFINLHVDEFTPYAVDKQTCRDLLDGVLHSLDVTMNFPDRVKRNSLVEVSTADIFYHLVVGVPNTIKNKLDNLDHIEQNQIIYQVFQDLATQTHNRSPFKLYLVKYITQENLSIATEPEALNTFIELLD